MESSSPRRNSSGYSNDTAQSDPKKWFDQNNENPTATYNNAMDVDPPFFQKESDSSNEDTKPYPFPRQVAVRNDTAQSSSADDYRSVIDDLTVEIQKLKEELKRYKHKGPDMLRKEKLFEIKIHGLPKRKKRELETTLREFAAGLEQSPDASSHRKKTSKHTSRDNMYSGSGSNSKHASSSTGSNTRPVDSAYASMSTGANSSGTSLGRPSMSSRAKSSEQKVESYLRDIPEGLYPRHIAMTERERKKLVVRRLEQLFTGKIRGRGTRPPIQSPKASASAILGPVLGKEQPRQSQPLVHQPPALAGAAGIAPGGAPGAASTAAPSVTIAEAAREARILPPEQNADGTKKSRSREDGSASNSNGDQTDSAGHGNSSGSGANTSPTDSNLPEQRPTRPKDLDPDRVQIPSENMDYIRHLGLVPPEILAESRYSMQDVRPDADGWVYLNLLCNLAQLHIVNVTPDFVRSAVADWSTKFQLSPDGRKIRWRGGSDGTKFSSDSSGNNSQRSPETEEEGHTKEDHRKRQRTENSTGDDFRSGTSSGKNASKSGPQISSEDSFHYKPMFVHHESSGGQTSGDDTLSSFGPIEDDNGEDSRWGHSGSGNTSGRRKRRRDGAIIYYSGAPFCTDLSGDPGDVSPVTYMMSSGQDQRGSPAQYAPPPLVRTDSGAVTASRPLSERVIDFSGEDTNMDIDGDDNVPGLSAGSDDESSDAEWDFPWSSKEQVSQVHCLEPCGLGGVLPDDHFTVMVTTKRRKTGRRSSVPSMHRTISDETTDSIIGRLAGMTTSSPVPPSRSSSRTRNALFEIDYVSGRIKRLAPVPLPPPVIYCHPFSTDSSWNDDMDSADEESEEFHDLEPSLGKLMSRKADQRQSDDYPDGVDLTSGDEDGEDPDDEPDSRRMYDKQNSSSEHILPSRRELTRQPSNGEGDDSGSSAATAGGAESGYNSSDEAS
jgi:hypothetical protein